MTIKDTELEDIRGCVGVLETINKYLREIKPGVFVDVYDVLTAWNVTNPALQHLIKKALQAGERGHKSREQDLQDIIDSAIRAKELEIKQCHSAISPSRNETQTTPTPEEHANEPTTLPAE